jgi:hypothetical protein
MSKTKTPPTLAELQEHRAALIEKFGSRETVAHANVSMTQLSIARHYGGINFNGKHFIYNPADDSLIREDVAKWIVKQRKEPKPCEP